MICLAPSRPSDTTLRPGVVFGLDARQKMLSLCCLVGCLIGCLLYGHGVTEADGPRGVSAGSRTKSAGVMLGQRLLKFNTNAGGDDF